MARARKFVIGYFIVIGAMTAVALVPSTLFAGMMLLMMVLGRGALILPLAPTILLYSAALYPAILVATDKSRRIGLAALLALLPVAIAVVPATLSRQQAAGFAERMSQNDVKGTGIAPPRTIALVGDAYAQEIGDNQTCNDICRRLLFNGEVAWVRVARVATAYAGVQNARTWPTTYRIERRDSCPQAYPAGITIEKAVRDRLVAGECVIADDVNKDDVPEATVRLTTSYRSQRYPSKPPKDGPVSIRSVKELQIEHSDKGAPPVLVFRSTETTASTVALPLYFNVELPLGGNPSDSIFGRQTNVTNPIDLTQILRSTFGFKLDPIAPPPGEDVAKIVERILSLPLDVEIFSPAQQQVIDEQLKLIHKKPALVDADVDLLRRVIADNRFDNGQLGVTLMGLFRHHRDRLAPLIPVAITRLKVPVPERHGHYQNSLGWGVAEYPAEALQPYRDDIVAILEEQRDWPTVPLLSRIAELGGDPIDLIARRLDAKSGTVRQFAAVAACRAPAALWPSLEPIVLAHLGQQRRNQLGDDEQKLMLALVRFGKKALVQDMIAKRGLHNKQRLDNRLATFEADFDPKRCRDSL